MHFRAKDPGTTVILATATVLRAPALRLRSVAKPWDATLGSGRSGGGLGVFGQTEGQTDRQASSLAWHKVLCNRGYDLKNNNDKMTHTYFFRASLRFLNLPSDDTSFWSLSIRALV